MTNVTYSYITPKSTCLQQDSNPQPQGGRKTISTIGLEALWYIKTID